MGMEEQEKGPREKEIPPEVTTKDGCSPDLPLKKAFFVLFPTHPLWKYKTNLFLNL